MHSESNFFAFTPTRVKTSRLMTTVDEIEDKICKAIRSVPIDSLKGDGAWTKAIFKAIADLGTKLDYHICSSRSDGEYDGGWLYDLIWYENDEKGQLKSLPLVLESEWDKNYKGVKYDFEKLLIARAKYKIMIFQARRKKLPQFFQQMQSAIEAFHTASEDESYLLVCFDEDSWAFQIKTIKIERSLHVTKVIEVAAPPKPAA
jgi:hypothetical protein